MHGQRIPYLLHLRAPHSERDGLLASMSGFVPANVRFAGRGRAQYAFSIFGGTVGVVPTRTRPVMRALSERFMFDRWIRFLSNITTSPTSQVVYTSSYCCTSSSIPTGTRLVADSALSLRLT